MSENSVWMEALPKSCPLPCAISPAGTIVYRAVGSLPATDLEFMKTIPTRPLPPGSECIALAVSLYTDLDRLKQNLKFGTNKRYAAIVKLTLKEEHGKMSKTGRPSHYSLWRFKDVLMHEDCTTVEVKSA